MLLGLTALKQDKQMPEDRQVATLLLKMVIRGKLTYSIKIRGDLQIILTRSIPMVCSLLWPRLPPTVN